DEDETVTRAPDDVLKSAGARIREGGQEVRFDLHQAIPDGLEVEAEGDVTVVTVRSATNPRLFMCVTASAALYISVFYWQDKFVSMPLAVALFGLAFYWKPRDARIRISKQTLGLGTVSTKGEQPLQSVETSRIVDVKVSARYESGKAVWQSTHSLRRALDEFATFTADSLEAVGAFLRKVRTRITAPADAEVPIAAPPRKDGPVPQTYTRTVHFLTEDGILAVPTRMSPEAAEWLCNLILSLLAAGAEATARTQEVRRAVVEEVE
ncbi:MAG: hypothetical protein RBU21_23945, partial [FCB group bacterium]|nr:hypothetical protein [FCB group bacterium]